MARLIEDGGATAKVLKPLKPPTKEPQRLPDPDTCAGSVIVINDPGSPDRMRLALSTGSAWRPLPFHDEIGAAPTPIDVTPIVGRFVAQALPDLVRQALPAVAPVTIEHRPQQVVSDPAIADAVSRMAALIQGQAQTIAELEARIINIESVRVVRSVQ